MAVELLEKGQNVSLKEKVEKGLNVVKFGLAWDESQGGHEFDADASVLLVGKDGKVISKEAGIVYYGLASQSGAPFSSKCGSVNHSGDNLTGNAAGDDEIVTITLDKVPAEVERVVLVTNIYDCKRRNQNFGQNTEYAVTVYDDATNEEMFKVDLREDHSTCTAMSVGELYRHDGSWKFRALVNGTKDTSLSEFINNNY